MSTVREKISNDLKEAMKNKEETKVLTLRMLKTEIVKYETSGDSKEVDESGLAKLLNTMKKQRLEAIEQYDNAGRKELADKERAELVIIESYLPQELSEGEICKIVSAAITEVGATDIKAMGNIMKVAMAKMQGKADGKKVSAEVKKQLESMK